MEWGLRIWASPMGLDPVSKTVTEKCTNQQPALDDWSHLTLEVPNVCYSTLCDLVIALVANNFIMLWHTIHF